MMTFPWIHSDECVPLVVVDVAGSGSPLSSSNGRELGGDVVGKAGVHGDIQLPAISCEKRQVKAKVSKKKFPNLRSASPAPGSCDPAGRPACERTVRLGSYSGPIAIKCRKMVSGKSAVASFWVVKNECFNWS
jgi:hypothetical protein